MDHTFVSILSLMFIAVLLVWLFKRVNLPPILAYLVAGVFVGPEVLKLFSDNEHMHLAAEVGIVFLLFSLGLEFSLARMMAMRKLVFGVGAGQMLLSTAVFAAFGIAAGQYVTTAIIIGASIALSSTAIVIKTMDEQGNLNTRRSQLAISILLFQDLAVVPLLIIIPILAGANEQSIGLAIVIALVKGVAAVLILMSVGKWLLPRIFNEIARTRTDELFVLSTILIALMAAGATYTLGLSMALGAFLAGMMLSESQYRYQLEADIRPFRDILMGLFFITVGMKLELAVLVSHLHYILLGLLLVIVIKVVVVRLAAWVSDTDSEDAWAAGFKLAQMGEFSFVIIALALANNLIPPMQSSILVSVGVLSMAITPWLIDKSGPYAKKLSNSPLPESLISEQQDDISQKMNHIVILGFGRVGQSIAKMLKLEALEYVSIDSDPIRVHESRTAGEAVLYGDVGHKDMLLSAGIDQAKLVIITFDEHNKSLRVINAIKNINPVISILVRTRKDYDMQELYDAGAVQVVPEIQEGSLMLISQVLHYSGIPMSRILKRIRDERKQGYQHMHGFYPGETTEISYQNKDKLEFMHAIVITDSAYAVGKTTEALGLVGKRVNLIAVRRNGQEHTSASSQFVIQARDVVVVSAKPRRVERIEKYLLDGG